MKIYLATTTLTELTEIIPNLPLDEPIRAYYVVTDEDQGSEYEVTLTYEGSYDGVTEETLSLPLIAESDGKYYYSCTWRTLNSVTTGSVTTGPATAPRETSSGVAPLFATADADLCVFGDFLIDAQREPKLFSISEELTELHTASWSVGYCHSSPTFKAADFDGTYFVNGYINSGTYGINCTTTWGRSPIFNEGGVLVYKKVGNALSQIQSIVPPLNASDRWRFFGNPKLDGNYLITQMQSSNLTDSSSLITRINVYTRDGDTFSYDHYIDEEFGSDNYQILEAYNGYLFMGEASATVQGRENQGSVRVYKRSSGGQYEFSHDLPFSGTETYFGYDVKAFGNLLMVSTEGSYSGGYSSGSYNYSFSTDPLPYDKGGVYFYELIDGAYELKSSFPNLTGASHGSIDLKNNVAVLGAIPGPGGSYGTYNLMEYGVPEEGFVYVFDRDESLGEWTQRSDTIKSTEVEDYSYWPDNMHQFRGFGYEVAFNDSATRLYVTAPVDRDSEGNRVGKIYDIQFN